MSVALTLTLVVFLPSLRNGFVGLDDPLYVVHNPAIKGFTSDNVRVVLIRTFLSTYLPVTMLSYMVDFQLFGLEPFGYHLTNLILHLTCTALLFLIAERLAGSVLVGSSRQPCSAFTLCTWNRSLGSRSVKTCSTAPASWGRSISICPT